MEQNHSLPMMHELTAYAPDAKRKQAMYRAAVSSVAQEMMKPTSAAPILPVMCHVRSFNLPEDQPTATPTTAETRYGGHVSTRVMVLSKPKLPTTVGKKLLKEQALRCIFCMKQSRYRRGSRMAAIRPALEPLLCSLPTVSRTMRACARSRSSGVSHHVVRGKSGSKKNPMAATPNVKAPSTMKSCL